MSGFSLKLLALVTMITDHIGAVFFPQLIWIRIIGRLSFPIYAFLIAEGFHYSKSRPKYLLRLVGFGIISELPYNFLFYGGLFDPFHQNIMFELALGVLVLFCMEKIKERQFLFILPAIALTLLSEYLCLSYGVYGIVLIVTAYILRSYGPRLQAVVSAMVTVLFNGVTDLYFLDLSILTTNSVQCYAIMAALPLMFYNGQKGKYSLKWLFYTAYPLHLILLILVRYLVKI